MLESYNLGKILAIRRDVEERPAKKPTEGGEIKAQDSKDSKVVDSATGVPQTITQQNDVPFSVNPSLNP